MTSFTIGADPELFVKYKGQPVAAIGLVEGTKESPFPVKNGAVQVDGLALEFNIDPASTFEEFNTNVVSVMKQMKAMVGPDYTFDIVPHRQFDPEYYEGLPEEAKVLGCDPDYNAWTGGLNPVPDGKIGLRGAGGHIHIGWGENIPVDHPEHLEICCNLVKFLDLTVGLASVLIDPAINRITMNGTAGSFRPKPYGVEYRVPSNVWIRNKEYRKFMWDSLQAALRVMQNGNTSNYYEHMKVAAGIINDDPKVIGICDWSRRREIAQQYFINATGYGIHIPDPFLMPEG